MIHVLSKGSYFVSKFNRDSIIANLTQVHREICMAGKPVAIIISKEDFDKFRQQHPYFGFERSSAKAKLGFGFNLNNEYKTQVMFSDRVPVGSAYGLFTEDFKKNITTSFILKELFNSPALDQLYDPDKFKALYSSIFLAAK